jgi:hypothetical protein
MTITRQALDETILAQPVAMPKAAAQARAKEVQASRLPHRARECVLERRAHRVG